MDWTPTLFVAEGNWLLVREELETTVQGHLVETETEVGVGKSDVDDEAERESILVALRTFHCRLPPTRIVRQCREGLTARAPTALKNFALVCQFK